MKPSPKALALAALLGCGDDGNTALDTDADTQPNNADLSMVYVTLTRSTNFGDPVLECSGGADVSVRNSVIVNLTNSPGSEIACPAADLSQTAVESTMTPEDWFANFTTGDLSLTPAGDTEFADIATWRAGDPPFDFEGDDRPSDDGAPDHPGADVP